MGLTGRKRNPTKTSMNIKFTGSALQTNVATPPTLPERIDAILDHVEKTSGVQYSRNSFILKSIRHYLDHLLASKDMNELLKKIAVTEVD